MPIVPTIGRKMYFRGKLLAGEVCNDPSQPFDATVTFVWNPSLVNLRVTDHAGNSFAASLVAVRQENEDAPQGQYVEWMTYQLGQAKKPYQLGQAKKEGA